MEKYIPDMYKKSIYDVNYEKLYKHGIRCILFDLNNTLVPINSKEVDKKLKELFDKLKKIGIKPILYSNACSKRLEIFKEALDIDGYCKTHKPYQNKAEEILKEYKESEIAMIGDSMTKDVAFGNKLVITTILVNPVSKVFPLTRIKEKHIMEKLRKNNLFVSGRYYE